MHINAEVDPNLWTEYPGVSVNRKTPRVEVGSGNDPGPKPPCQPPGGRGGWRPKLPSLTFLSAARTAGAASFEAAFLTGAAQ